MSITPVSIIQEYCVRNNISPQYDLIIDGTGSHDSLFKYKLTVNETTAFGISKSKKKAKQEAAKNVATLLTNLFHDKLNLNRTVDIEYQLEDLKSPYQGALNENAIGDLATICIKNNLPPANFILLREEGPPHDKLFTIECQVANYKETASSRTKQQAKHYSAKLMCELIKKIVYEKLLTSPGTNKKDNDCNENYESKLHCKACISNPVGECHIDDVKSPYPGALKENAIGDLATICVKNNFPSANFMILQEEGPPHNKLFTIECQVADYKRTGSSRTKQQAKHHSAKLMCELLKQIVGEKLLTTKKDNDYNKNHESKLDSKECVSNPVIECHIEDVRSPYLGVLKENAIGELATICIYNNLPSPNFNFVGEEGPPHNKLFTFECQVATYKETASSRTKQQAKHHSAKLMSKRLKEMVGDKLIITASETAEKDPFFNEYFNENYDNEVLRKVKAFFKSIKKETLFHKSKISVEDYHKIDLSTLYDANPIPLLKLYEHDIFDMKINLLHFMDKLKDCLKESIEIYQLPSRRSNVFIYICLLKSSPPFVHYGMSNIKEKAKRIAFHKMLNFLSSFSYVNNTIDK